MFFGWTLLEVLTVYTGEWLLLVLVVYARVIIARRLPPDPPDGRRAFGGLLTQKLMAFFITLPFYALCLGIFGFVAVAALQADAVPESSIRVILFCLAAFAATHLVMFIRQAAAGAFYELVTDRVILMPFWRFPLLIVILVIALFMQDPQFGYRPAAFVVVVALIAVLDTVLQRMDADYVESRIERLDHQD